MHRRKKLCNLIKYFPYNILNIFLCQRPKLTKKVFKLKTYLFGNFQTNLMIKPN